MGPFDQAIRKDLRQNDHLIAVLEKPDRREGDAPAVPPLLATPFRPEWLSGSRLLFRTAGKVRAIVPVRGRRQGGD